MTAIKRIIGSQKAIYAAIPMLANAVMTICGVDITQPAVLVLDAGFGLLLLAQFILDLRWGSPSDGTGSFNGTGTTDGPVEASTDTPG